MLKKDILKSLKDIKDATFELRVKVNVITKEEFVKISGKRDRQVEKLMQELEKE